MAQESDPKISEAIQHSRLEEGAHTTPELEITRSATSPKNRPLTDAEKRAQRPKWTEKKKEQDYSDD